MGTEDRSEPPPVQAQEEGAPTSSLPYKAFISYSHTADGELAPALRSGLHRFAKPWYRVRAVRVFRDEASLSANPALWSSIERALAGSEFFILLASPDAARSEWVEREVRYWCEHKPREKLLIAVTGGTIVWAERLGDFDWTKTDALPPCLRGVFGEEPRYVDLRWIGQGKSVAGRDPRFRECIADLAAPLHGLSKDDLIGEDVRQHRRTIRLARLAITSLAVFAVAAVVSAVLAVGQRNAARDQRDLARSRQLAAHAAAAPVDRSLLLSLEALARADTKEARSALLASLHRGAIGYLHNNEPVRGVSYSSDGTMLACGRDDGAILLWDPRSHDRLGELRGHDGPVTTVAFNPDGNDARRGRQGRSHRPVGPPDPSAPG